MTDWRFDALCVSVGAACGLIVAIIHKVLS